MEKSQLKELVERGYSSCDIAKEVSKGNSTVVYWLKKYGLKTILMRNREERQGGYLCSCGETNEHNFHDKGKGRKSRSKCKKCHATYCNKRHRRSKLEAVKYKGGCCLLCGYNKCAGSLDFHHRDPDGKDLNWHKMRFWKFDKVKAELDKCDLLCRNCHGEVHWLDEGP